MSHEKLGSIKYTVIKQLIHKPIIHVFTLWVDFGPQALFLPSNCVYVLIAPCWQAAVETCYQIGHRRNKPEVCQIQFLSS